MLGNGYKERLANAQSSIGSLLLNLSKQQQMNSSLPTSSSLHDSNESGLDLPLKQSFASKLTATPPAPSPPLPLPSAPAPAPVLESNSSSRFSSLRQQQQLLNQQEQRRTSRLPSAGFSLGRLLDQQFPELGSQVESNGGSRRQQGRNLASSSSTAVMDDFGLHLEPSFALSQGQGVAGASSFNSSRSPSRWDGSTPGGSTAATSVYDGNCTPMSNSPTFVTGAVGNRNYQSTQQQQQQQPQSLAGAKGFETGIRDESTIPTLEAALIIQRAMRRFLVRKHAKATIQATVDSSLLLVKDFQPAGSKALNSPMLTTEKQEQQQQQADLESLQQTCLRQSAEIDQLKDMMTRLLLEAEEDRRKLRQRDQEVEELLKQKLVATTSTPPPLPSSLAALPPIQTSGFDNILSKNASRFSSGQMGAGNGMATAATAPSFASYGLSSMQSTASALGEDLTHHGLDGISDDDYYGVEGLTSFANSTGGVSTSSVHPLSVNSRSNSIHSVHSQQSSTGGVPLGLKINAANAYAYQGYMDMVDSPTSDYSPHHDLGSATGGLGRQQQSLPGFNPQGVSTSNAFPTLSHRSSAASFSSGSRAFDSPALEQQGAYPWNMNANVGPAGVSNSPSWNDDMSSGYGYDSPTSATFQSSGTMGHAGYDPQYISQYGQHVSQLQQQAQQHPQSTQQSQPQQQPQQAGGGGSSSYRNSYRRHSDKPVHLDYQMCVDRILQATDQQASIHLQQKLKTSPPEQKIQIIDAILGQAYALMSNRFGNFLIQRCFEFGSAQQIDALAQAMRGNILTLACDPFGCHVVQKALDNVQEDAKARIVTEMFRRIRETIVHRYACHVWQKVFEIRWTDAPPAVMTYVNSAVAGRWASVAVDETGSLVVQNIYENCAEHDKRPVLNEILQSVTTIAKGQWGNWVIQHILEHGSPADRATVTQKILEDAVNLSLDQYASKVVEKTLRMAANGTLSAPTAVLQQSNASTSPKSASIANGSPSSSVPPTVTIHGTTTIRLTQEEVMGQYIHIVCDGVPDRPRIPLIDIAADQYGNYIVQYILTHAGPQHREICAVLIKRHMVSLRGSKYGQKVAFMVERWRGSPFSNNNGGAGGSGGISGGEGRSNGGGNGGGGGSGGPGAFNNKIGSGSDGHGHEQQQRSSGGRRRW